MVEFLTKPASGLEPEITEAFWVSDVQVLFEPE
jgi:hypothetical protein